MRVWIDGCLCGLWEVVPSKWRFFFFSWAGFFFFFVSNAAPPFLNLRQPIQENGIKEDSRILVVKKTSFPCLIVAWACDDAKGKKKEKKKKKKKKKGKRKNETSFTGNLQLSSPLDWDLLKKKGKGKGNKFLFVYWTKMAPKQKGKKGTNQTEWPIDLSNMAGNTSINTRTCEMRAIKEPIILPVQRLSNKNANFFRNYD